MATVRAPRKGFTIIELVVVMTAAGIIGLIAAGTIASFTQFFIFSPQQLNTEKASQDLVWIVFEGDGAVPGVRYARRLWGASATQLTYGPVVDDGYRVRFRWDQNDRKIYRSVMTGSVWGGEEAVPRYFQTNMHIDGIVANTIFTYRRANDSSWSASNGLAAIRRVIINVSLSTGSGNFSDFQGTARATSSVELKGFQP